MEQRSIEQPNQEDYREIISKNINNTLDYGFIPELGRHKSGKVREIHFTSLEIGRPIVMVASDRVSVFDHVLDRRIPFKGRVLNLLNTWAMKNTEDIVPNASMSSPHANVLIQKYYRNIMVECVVRGYVWGSMAEEYEKGKREACGVKLQEGLLRYQKLDEPMFTPTTKAEHDEPMTFEQVSKLVGKELAEKVRDISIKLYKRGAELALKAGLLFVDTKYEFGTDENGNLFLIDEANTPDSSRYCSVEEYKKFEKIRAGMSTGPYKNVSELLRQRPELKIQELSKQFVRDVIIEKGFGYGSTGKPPSLPDEDVIEVSSRYINLYETLTGQKFEFPSSNIRSEMIQKLGEEGYIKGCLCVIIAGSDSDMQHMEKIRGELEKYGISSQIRICSAHKQPSACEELVKAYNNSIEPLVFISVAGGTDALSGVLSFLSVHPVISCPPSSDNFNSCTMNPSGSSNSLILNPANVAKHVAQIFGHQLPGLQKSILEKNDERLGKLAAADESLRG